MEGHRLQEKGWGLDIRSVASWATCLFFFFAFGFWPPFILHTWTELTNHDFPHCTLHIVLLARNAVHTGTVHIWYTVVLHIFSNPSIAKLPKTEGVGSDEQASLVPLDFILSLRCLQSL